LTEPTLAELYHGSRTEERPLALNRSSKQRCCGSFIVRELSERDRLLKPNDGTVTQPWNGDAAMEQ